MKKQLHRYNVSMLEKESIITLCEYRGYKIKQKGNSKFIYCPEHEKNLEDSSHPVSNCVVNNDESSCFCYVCNKKWDVVHYIQEKESLNFPAALNEVWESIGCPVSYILNSNYSMEEIEQMNKRNKEQAKQRTTIGLTINEKMVSKNEGKNMILAKCLFLSKRFLDIEKRFNKDFFTEEKETIRKIQSEKKET